MKKILFSIFSLTLLMSLNVSAQSDRLVLIEEFTQASCPPCEASTPELNATLLANEAKVVQLRYQTSWPGVDPMNADNPGEVATRVGYYGVTGVPDLFIEGGDPTPATFPTLVTTANIDAAFAVDAPVKVEVAHTISSNLDSIEITATITNEGTETYAAVATNRFRVAVVEQEIEFRFRPGSTSILVYEYVMKNFATGTDGIEIPEILAGEAWTQTWTVAVPAKVYDLNEIGVVAFLQDDSDKHIVNSGVSHAYDIAGYSELTTFSQGAANSASFCDYGYKPELLVVNDGAGEASGFSASVLLNTEVVQTVEYTDAVAGDEQVVVQFDELMLEAGSSEISYEVTNNSAAADFDLLNNVTAPEFYSKVSADGSASLDYGFESDAIGSVPANTGLDAEYRGNNFVAVDGAFYGGNNVLGGYAESNQSTLVNFYQWNPASVDANGTWTVLDQWNVNVGDTDTAFVSFDYAYTSYGGSNDRLILEISTDCGDSFTELFNKAGEDLRTAPEVNGAPFQPAADEWVTERINITEYNGNVVMMRFRAVSAWGDMGYIDNFKTEVAVLSSNENLVNVSGLEVYPNPAQDFTNIKFELTETKPVTFEVIDNLGRVVSSVDFGLLSGTQNLNLNLNELATGFYTIRGNFGNEVSMNKIYVTK